MEWGTPVKWGKFLLFCVHQSVKTKETYPSRPGPPTPCKQALRIRNYRSETTKSTTNETYKILNQKVLRT